MPTTTPTTTRSASRAASTARTQVLSQLKDDHKRVKKAYRDFQKLDDQDDTAACSAIVAKVLDELTVHAAIEEEFLYPAARGAIADDGLIDEAEVEHESLHRLIDQLRDMDPDDDKYTARFTVLCEYVLHHVKEEEGEMFPRLERAKLDWESLASDMNERRAELMPADEQARSVEDDAHTAGAKAAPKRRTPDSEDDERAVGSAAASRAAPSHRGSS